MSKAQFVAECFGRWQRDTVKRLFFNNKCRAADFYNEVNIISGVEHKNLVRLLGCSCLGPESLLVYEFLPNQNLHILFKLLLCPV
ncbi:hypothetical protein T459_29862 [Capsicum annuum]|uniref:Serine-threonine/tyrosine-protein kinase catalytic domain-containing protein n=1 Tax=Capsicum annuum TaxID=4072 RepID=A0A2G2Y6P6_CAPAN|nr:hypothetical protein T459_29862 [Capsicum annuum]